MKRVLWVTAPTWPQRFGVRAVDEAEAISLVKNAINLYGQFTSLTAEPVNYTMYLGFLESDRQALEEVTHEVVREERPDPFAHR